MNTFEKNVKMNTKAFRTIKGFTNLMFAYGMYMIVNIFFYFPEEKPLWWLRRQVSWHPNVENHKELPSVYK